MLRDKLYKYWFFYSKDTNELYAYTDDKNLANGFESQRDMNKFIKVKKKISRSLVNDLARDYDGEYLLEGGMRVYDSVTKETSECKLVVTKIEWITVSSTGFSFVNEEIYRYCWLSPHVFNDEIFNALKVVGYNDIHNVLVRTENDNDINDPFDYIIPDDLGIFLKYYGETMR